MTFVTNLTVDRRNEAVYLHVDAGTELGQFRADLTVLDGSLVVDSTPSNRGQYWKRLKDDRHGRTRYHFPFERFVRIVEGRGVSDGKYDLPDGLSPDGLTVCIKTRDLIRKSRRRPEGTATTGPLQYAASGTGGPPTVAPATEGSIWINGPADRVDKMRRAAKMLGLDCTDM